MEVFLKMEGSLPQSSSSSESTSETLMLGQFSMVCRDSYTHKAKKVPPLIVETEEEKILWSIGEDHKRRKAETSLVALDKVPPSSAEAEELHELMLTVNEEGAKEIEGEQVVKMKDTEVDLLGWRSTVC